MRNLLEVSAVTCFVGSPVFGFHAALPLPNTYHSIPNAPRTALSASASSSTTALRYKNKTDAFFDVPIAASTARNIENGMIYTNGWGSYEASGENVAMLEEPGLFVEEPSQLVEGPGLLESVDDNNEYTTTYSISDEDEDVDEEDRWGTEYEDYEGTPLGLLKSWTQDYIDAVDLAGGMTRVSVGVQHMLSSEFVFSSPTIGPLSKPDYVKLMDYYRLCGLDLASAIPDLKVHYDGWHLDPHDPNRIWVVARYSGTHVGTAAVPGTDLKLTPPNTGDHPVTFTTGPEMQSFLWTTDKELLWHTAGYVGDGYTGSNQGYGGLDGLLVSMGLPHLYLDSMSPVRRFKSWFSQFQSDNGETMARTKTRFGRLPQWWNERKLYDLNIHK